MQFTCFPANQSASVFNNGAARESTRIIWADKGANSVAVRCAFEIIYLRVLSEQHSHSAQLTFQQELLFPVPLGFGQIASATLQFVPQPAQSLLEYFLRELNRPCV